RGPPPPGTGAAGRPPARAAPVQPDPDPAAASQDRRPHSRTDQDRSAAGSEPAVAAAVEQTAQVLQPLQPLQSLQSLQPLQPDAGQDCGATGGCATWPGSKGLEPAVFAAVGGHGGNGGNGGNGGEPPPGARPIGEPTWPAPDPLLNYQERREMEGQLRNLNGRGRRR